MKNCIVHGILIGCLHMWGHLYLGHRTHSRRARADYYILDGAGRWAIRVLRPSQFLPRYRRDSALAAPRPRASPPALRWGLLFGVTPVPPDSGPGLGSR